MAVAALRKRAAEPADAQAAFGKGIPIFAADTDVGAGLQLALAASMRPLRSAIPEGDPIPPHAIHRLRVGVRRLRSLLSAFQDALPATERRDLGHALGELAQRVGRAREWDVVLTDFVSALARNRPDDEAVAEIAQAAAAARQLTLPPAPELTAAIGAVQAALDAAPWLHAPAPEFAEIWATPLHAFVSELLGHRHRQLRKRLKSIDLADQAAFHQVRLTAKKLRYPAEMFQSLFDKKKLAPYLDRLILVQNQLGHLNDALAAPALLAQLSLPDRARGLAEGWLAREAIADRDGFPALARKFRHCKPFWES